MLQKVDVLSCQGSQVIHSADTIKCSTLAQRRHISIVGKCSNNLKKAKVNIFQTLLWRCKILSSQGGLKCLKLIQLRNIVWNCSALFWAYMKMSKDAKKKIGKCCTQNSCPQSFCTMLPEWIIKMPIWRFNPNSGNSALVIFATANYTKDWNNHSYRQFTSVLQAVDGT